MLHPALSISLRCLDLYPLALSGISGTVLAGAALRGNAARKGLAMSVRLRLVVTTIWYLGFISGIHAETIMIRDHRGGPVDYYAESFSSMAVSGQDVIIDGVCLSACTLVLGLIPRERVCATSSARFGFHSAYALVPWGKVHHAEGTQKLLNSYATDVLQWIQERGGLRPRMMYAKATRFVRRCAPDTRFHEASVWHEWQPPRPTPLPRARSDKRR